MLCPITQRKIKAASKTAKLFNDYNLKVYGCPLLSVARFKKKLLLHFEEYDHINAVSVGEYIITSQTYKTGYYLLDRLTRDKYQQIIWEELC